MSRKKRFWAGLAAVLAVLALACALYVNDYYRAGEAARMALEQPAAGVAVVYGEGDTIAFVPQQPMAGLVFYPGGKVQCEAYAPLLERLAEKGVLCVLVKMPCNLAVLGIGKAEGIPARYPQVEHWYLGGHSLGGAMTAAYLGKNAGEYQGLVLLAAYSTGKVDLPALAVYGENDGVMKRDSYAKYRANLPDFTEVILPGGNHAGFADYGPQKGDGEAAIPMEQQVELTAEAIAAFAGAA